VNFLLAMLFGNPKAKKQAHEWVDAGATLLDVRTPAEFQSGHLPGAKNIPVAELKRRMKEVGRRGSKVVVYCRSGARSASITPMLRDAGYEVLDIGPMTVW